MAGFGRLVHLVTLRSLRCHPLRAGLTVLAVAAGTSMAVTVPAVQTSVERSVEQFGEALAGPGELRVVGATRRGGLDGDLARRIAGIDGVRSVAPMVQAVALAGDPAATPGNGSEAQRPVLALGLDCLTADTLLGDGLPGCPAPPPAREAAASGRPLARGPGIDGHHLLRTNRGGVQLDGVPVLDWPGGLGEGRFVVFGLATAQHLFDRGDRFDVLYVEPEPGQDTGTLRAALREVAGPHNGVLDATQGPPEVAGAVSDFLPLFSLLALFALGTGAMLVHNTVTLSVEQRRRELGIVGALGGTRRVVAGAVLGEALLLGGLGGLGGAAAGIAVADPIVTSLASYTERTAGIPLQVHAGPGALAAGILLGLGTALIAAVPGVRRATRLDAAAELSGRDLRVESSSPRLARRTAVPAAVMAIGLTLVWLAGRDGGLEPWQHPAGAAGFTMAALATVLAGATVTPLLIRPLRPLLRRSAAGRLALTNLTTASGRTGVMVAALAAAATTAFLAAGFGQGYTSAVTDGVRENMTGVRVSSVRAGPNINVDAGIPPDALDALARVDGVAATYRGTAVLTGSPDGRVLLVTAYQDPWETEGETPGVRGTVDPEGFAAGEALISTSLARNTGLRPGDEVAVPTPRGMVELPVQAVVHGGGPGSGRVSIAYDTHVDLYGRQPVRSVYVEAEPGLSPARLSRRIEGADLGMELRIETPDQVIAESRRAVARQMAPFWTLQRGLLAVAFVAIVSTMLLAGVQRRRELATLAAAGAGPSTLALTVIIEVLVVALAATVLAAAGGAVLLRAMTALTPLMMGFPIPFTPDLLSVLMAGGMALAVALLAALAPARRASRTEVLASLRSE